MDRFFDQKNIARYRKLRDAGMDETQRAMILKQLAEEEEKFRKQLWLHRSCVDTSSLVKNSASGQFGLGE